MLPHERAKRRHVSENTSQTKRIFTVAGSMLNEAQTLARCAVAPRWRLSAPYRGV